MALVVSLLLIGTVKLLSFFRDMNYYRGNSFERVSILEQSHSQGVALRLSGAKMDLTREESKQAQKHCCSAPWLEAGIGTRPPYAVVEYSNFLEFTLLIPLQTIDGSMNIPASSDSDSENAHANRSPDQPPEKY